MGYYIKVTQALLNRIDELFTHNCELTTQQLLAELDANFKKSQLNFMCEKYGYEDGQLLKHIIDSVINMHEMTKGCVTYVSCDCDDCKRCIY